MSTTPVDEVSTSLEMDDVELVLRRFASEQGNDALNKLINSMFTETAAQKVAHETSAKDPVEDSKEGE